MRGQSVASAVGARVWTAAIAACTAYGSAAAQLLGPGQAGQREDV